MNKLLQLTLILLIMVSCTEPTKEDALKKTLEDQLGKSISEVIIGDTVMVSTLKSQLLGIDSSIIEMENRTTALEQSTIDLKKSLQDLKDQLSKGVGDLSYYIITESIIDIEKTIKESDETIENNIIIMEDLNSTKENLESLIKSSDEKIAFINVVAKTEQSELKLMVSPDFKILKRK